MKRILVIGSPGAGKSVFARRLGQSLSIEVIHLDRWYWRPGWKEMPRMEWVSVQETLVERPSWIIDGYYGATLDIRLKAADTIIFLDYPRRICLKRAIIRGVRERFVPRPDMPSGLEARVDISFYQYIWMFSSQQRLNILRAIDTFRASQGTVIVLRNPWQARSFLHSVGKDFRGVQEEG